MTPTPPLTRSISVDSSEAPLGTAQGTPPEMERATTAPLQLKDTDINAALEAVRIEGELIVDAAPLEHADTMDGETERKVTFSNLPLETHSKICDKIFGELRPIRPDETTGTEPISEWEKGLRHPRTKKFADLALLSDTWKIMVQSRIYRSLKIEATHDAVYQCIMWFKSHPHLRMYVRNIEVQFPVWANRVLPANAVGEYQDEIHFGPDDHDFYSMPRKWLLPLQDILIHIKVFYPKLTMLTLQGGTCINGQVVRHFHDEDPFFWIYCPELPILSNVKTLVMRGSYNLVRHWAHWRTLARAFPNLQHWDSTWWPFNVDNWNLMKRALVCPPAKLKHLTLSFDGLCGLGELPEVHMKTLCKELGEAAARMESFTLTGRICGRFFSKLCKEYRSVRDKSLHTLNLNVEALCNDCHAHVDDPFIKPHIPVTGMQNPMYVRDFEIITLNAILALRFVPTIKRINIRTLEVDSEWLMFAPYFEFNGHTCRGFWSTATVAALTSVRDNKVSYISLMDGIYPELDKEGNVVGVLPPAGPGRPNSLRKEAYWLLEDRY